VMYALSQMRKKLAIDHGPGPPVATRCADLLQIDCRRRPDCELQVSGTGGVRSPSTSPWKTRLAVMSRPPIVIRSPLSGHCRGGLNRRVGPGA